MKIKFDPVVAFLARERGLIADEAELTNLLDDVATQSDCHYAIVAEAVRAPGGPYRLEIVLDGSTRLLDLPIEDAFALLRTVEQEERARERAVTSSPFEIFPHAA